MGSRDSIIFILLVKVYLSTYLDLSYSLELNRSEAKRVYSKLVYSILLLIVLPS